MCACAADRSVWEGYAFEVLKRALLIEQTQAFHERFPEQGVAATEVLTRAGKGKLSEEAAAEEALEIGSLTAAFEVDANRKAAAASSSAAAEEDDEEESARAAARAKTRMETLARVQSGRLLPRVTGLR